MQVKIQKPFLHESSPRPFVANELVEAPDELAREWIAEGKAIAFVPAAKPVVNAVPPRKQREKATRVS
jgi:hypothetical protein